jgi:alcohol dehydrogenase class IV
MNIVTLLQPPRIVFGNGCAPQCAEFLAQRGVKRVLLVSSTPVLPALGHGEGGAEKIRRRIHSRAAGGLRADAGTV